MSVVERIRVKLTATLSPTHVELVDESALHAGHAGARPEGESHFRLIVVSDRFIGHGRLERQRMIYQALDELMQSDIHALSIKALTPDEAAAQQA